MNLFKAKLGFRMLALMMWPLLFFACSVPSRLAVSDISALYRGAASPAFYHMNVFHENDSVTDVSLLFPLNRPAKGRIKTGTEHKRLVFEYSLRPSYEKKQIIDSATFILEDSLTAGKAEVPVHFKVKTGTGGTFALQCELYDEASGIRYPAIRSFSKSAGKDAGWFRLQSVSGRDEGVMAPDGFMTLLTSAQNNHRVYGYTFRRDFPPAAPPFAGETRAPFDYKADSVFVLDLKSGISSPFRLRDAGFTLFRQDTTSWEGFTVFRMEESYPEITSSRQMLEPLRYITTGREFGEISGSPDLKASIDSFWVANAGSEARAIEQISYYYKRVKEANELFFSYCEGWKTDRGMIYIVFGPPNQVFRSDFEEVWYYGEANNYKSLQFRFYKAINPFTENDYVLQRQPTFKAYWYNAIQLWRR